MLSVETAGVAKVFSQVTLGKFEDASASIPLRQLVRAFDAVGIHMGADPGGAAGDRKVHFRRYVAGINQRVAPQQARLGAALGALIDEVATSKQAFLVQAAELDGFVFANGVFAPATTRPTSFAVTSVEDLASIDDRGRRLQLLANKSPKDAVAGVREFVESACRTVLSLSGKPAPAKTATLDAIVKATLGALEPVPTGTEQLGAAVASLVELRKGLSARDARLAVGAAVAFTTFVAETFRA